MCVWGGGGGGGGGGGFSEQMVWGHFLGTYQRQVKTTIIRLYIKQVEML